LFESKSERVVDYTIPNLQFLVDLKTERSNWSIHNYIATQPPNPIASPLQTMHTPPTPPRPNSPRVMATHFAPLVLPQVQDDIPVDYRSKTPFFDDTPNSITTQKNVDKMTDFYKFMRSMWRMWK